MNAAASSHEFRRHQKSAASDITREAQEFMKQPCTELSDGAMELIPQTHYPPNYQFFE